MTTARDAFRLAAFSAAVLLMSSCSALLGTFQPDIAAMEKAIEEEIGTPVTVVCPSDIPLGKGTITDCTVSDGIDKKYLRITQDDDQGHYTWEITSQDAP